MDVLHTTEADTGKADDKFVENVQTSLPTATISLVKQFITLVLVCRRQSRDARQDFQPETRNGALGIGSIRKFIRL